MSTSLSKMYQKLKDSIVSIEGIKQGKAIQTEALPFLHPYEQEERKISYGSGVVIHPSGFILTCHHVVQGMNIIRVRIGNQKSVHYGKLVWFKEDKDIAVLKVQTQQRLRSVSFSFSNHIPIGERVFAIGNPFGFDHTLTSGVLSGKNRNISTDDHKYNVVLQTDTALNPGNSGGPLFDSKGRVIGINAVIIPAYQNMGFAIPTEEFYEYIKRYLPSLKRR